MKNKTLLIILFFCSLTTDLYCQKNPALLKISPQHFIVSTLKFELEKGLSDKSSIGLAPFATVFDQSDESVYGGGLELRKKFYVYGGDSALPLTGFYAGVSANYGYFNAKYSYSDRDPSFCGYDQFGNYTCNYPLIENKETIHQFGMDAEFGYQVSIKGIFYLDTFLGGGVRYGHSSIGRETNYSFSILEYAFKGVIPKIGLRLGLRL
jgi:hypothetical protein